MSSSSAPVAAPVVSTTGSTTGLAGRRGLSLAMGLCVVGGAAALWAAGRVWVHYNVDVAPLPAHVATATGHRADAFASTGALVVLAGVVALPATRAVGRRIAGALIVLAGLGLGWGALAVLRSPAAHVAAPDSSAPLVAHASAWPWVAAGGGALAVAAGGLAMFTSARWPSMGRRYEAGPGVKQRPVTEVSMWDRLDDGDDPTA